jgi:signal transduction histidine kinase
MRFCQRIASQTKSGLWDISIGLDDVEFLSTRAIGRKVELVSVIIPEVLSILGDRIQLQQVILNLVVNGIDAMKDTPAESRIISIRTSRIEEFAELSVSDRGPGIPEDKFRAILHQQDRRHGDGAVHRAHHYRGAPWVDMGENRDHGGASFRIKLPLVQ